MSILSKILGTAVAEPVDAIKELIGAVYTTDGQRLDKKTMLLRVEQSPLLAQIKLNTQQAAHKSKFVSGARPAMMYVCTLCVGLFFIPQFTLGSYLWYNACIEAHKLLPYPISGKLLFEFTGTLFGLWTASRTYEKIKGVAS